MLKKLRLKIVVSNMTIGGLHHKVGKKKSIVILYSLEVRDWINK